MRKKDFAINLIVSLVLALFALSLLSLGVRYFECRNALSKLPLFPASDYAHVIVYGSSEHSVSGTLMLYDTDGTEISRVERSWNDTRISIDYVIVTMNGKSAAFPYRMFGGTSAPLSRGKSLAPYILSGGECTLIGSSMGKQNRRHWGTVARFAFSAASRIFAGTIHFTTINLAGCEPGKEYLLKTDSFGNISLSL